MAKTVWKIDKFEGGLNDYSDPKDIKSNEFADINDAFIGKAGSVRPLGRCINSDIIPKTDIKNDIIAGEGAYAFKTNYGFNIIQDDLSENTQYTLTRTQTANNGEYARARFKIVSMVWAFTSSNDLYANHNEPMANHDDLIMSQGALKLTMYLGSTAITAEQTVLTFNGDSDGSSSWFDDATRTSPPGSEGSAGYYGDGDAAKNFAYPYNIWTHHSNQSNILYDVPGNSYDHIFGGYNPTYEQDINLNSLFYSDGSMTSSQNNLYILQPPNGIVQNGKNSYDKPLGNNARFGVGPYYFEGYTVSDFPITNTYWDNRPWVGQSRYASSVGIMTEEGRINQTSQIIKPHVPEYSTNAGGFYNNELTGNLFNEYNPLIAALYKNLKASINAYTSTSGIVCTWTDGDNDDQLAGLEIRANTVGTTFNNANIEFTLNSSGLEGTVTQVTQTRGTTNLNLLTTADREGDTIDVDKENGVVLSGQTYMSGGAAALADTYTITFSGGFNNGDEIFISVNPTGANVTATNLQVKNMYASLNDLASAVATAINTVSTISASSDGAVVTVTGTAGTANGFNINMIVTPDIHSNIFQNIFYDRTREDKQYILLNKSGDLHIGSSINYKSNFKIYSTNNSSWLDIFSDENSSLNPLQSSFPTTSFFDWYYTSNNDNKPSIASNGERVFLSDGNFSLNNNNKYFGFIDNSYFFSNPNVDDFDNNGFTFVGRTFGWFLEDSAKKWTFTQGSTINSLWTFPDKMGVRIDANSSISTAHNADEAKMEFKIYTATGDGVDWSGKIKVYLAAVYDDGTESLPGHQFTFSGGSQTLDLSADASSLKIECSIRPQNDSGKYLFNDRRITGVRLYYTSDEDDYEMFYNLGLADFNKGFIRAAEIQTLDDTTGNASRYVWSDNGQTGANAVRLWDMDAASNNQIIEYTTQPRMDDYVSINEIELTTSSMPTTLDVRYKAICIAGRRAFIGNLKIVDNNGTKYYNDRMIFSPQNNFDIFPNSDSNILEIETFDGDEIIALASYGDRVLQFKKDVLYILDISGEASNWSVESRDLYKGILNNHSFCETLEGIFWFNKYGAYMYNGEETINLFLTENEEKTTNRINLETWESFVSSESVCGFNPKSREIFVVKKTNQTSNESDGDCYVYNLMTKSWVKGSDKFYTGGKITNFINVGDLRQLGFFTSVDRIPAVPKGESNNPGVPF